MSARQVFKEGDLFKVPLASGGFALGVLARKSRRTMCMFGYFFGPRLFENPDLESIATLKYELAVETLMFSGLGLQQGEWVVLGQIPNWDRTKWPLTKFVNESEGRGYAWITTYDETNLCKQIETVPCKEGSTSLPKDGSWGFVAVERLLDRKLD